MVERNIRLPTSPRRRLAPFNTHSPRSRSKTVRPVVPEYGDESGRVGQDVVVPVVVGSLVVGERPAPEIVARLPTVEERLGPIGLGVTRTATVVGRPRDGPTVGVGGSSACGSEEGDAHATRPDMVVV